MTSKGKIATFSPKKTSNALRKFKSSKLVQLVQYKSSSDDEDIMNQHTKDIVVSKNGGFSTSPKSTQIIPTGDISLDKRYLMWENSANVCWLDASMALLVHNRTLIESLDQNSSTQIKNIICYYYEAVSILNDYSDEKHIDIRVKAAKDLLKTVQEAVLKYLQPILKYKEGEPDSAFCSLFNLITENKSIKDFFDLEFAWVQECNQCNMRRVKKHRKPIITFSRVAIFQPSSPIAIYTCPVCKEPDQNMILNFRTLPQCLLFHFESGAGKGELQFNDFELDKRTYRMTGVMTLEKAKESLVNHFITYVRDPASDTWLECNDLNDEIMCFSMIPPTIQLEDLYIIMYEAEDKLGTLPNRSLALDRMGSGEESGSGSADIPLIDLADDTDNLSSEKGNKRCFEIKEGSKKSKNVGLLESSEDYTNLGFSKPLNEDPASRVSKSEEKTQSGFKLVFDEVTTTHILIHLPSQSCTNEIGVAPEMKHATEGRQATESTASIDAVDSSSAKDTKFSSQNLTATKRILTSLNSVDIPSKMSDNSTLDQHINKTAKNLPNDTCGNKSQSCISMNEINSILNDQPSENDLKATNESKIFMLNLDLCPKPRIEKTWQNKLHISSLDKLKKNDSISTGMNLEKNDETMINISPTKIKASTKLNDPLYKATSESPKSEAQIFTKKYQTLMHTLRNTELKQVIPLQMFTENDNKSVACEVPNSKQSEFQQIITNKKTPSKELHINRLVGITNGSRSEISKTEAKILSNQDQQEYKDCNYQSAHSKAHSKCSFNEEQIRHMDLSSFEEEQSTRITKQHGPQEGYKNMNTKYSDVEVNNVPSELLVSHEYKGSESEINSKRTSDLYLLDVKKSDSAVTTAKKQRSRKAIENVLIKSFEVEVKDIIGQANKTKGKPLLKLIKQKHKESSPQTAPTNSKKYGMGMFESKKEQSTSLVVATTKNRSLLKPPKNVNTKPSATEVKKLSQMNKALNESLPSKECNIPDYHTVYTKPQNECDVNNSLMLITQKLSLRKTAENIPTKPSAEVPTKDPRNQDNTTVCNDYSSQTFHTNLSLFEAKEKESTKSTVKTTRDNKLHRAPRDCYRSEIATEVTTKVLRSNFRKTQSKQDKQEHKAFDSQTVYTDFEKESEPSLINIKEANLVNSTTKRQRLQNTDLKTSGIAVKGKRGKVNKTQMELLLSHEQKTSHSEIVHNNSDKRKVDAEDKELTALAAPNPKRRRCKSNTSSLHKEEQQTTVQAVQPKKQCRHLGVSEPKSAAELEKSSEVITEKSVSKSTVQAAHSKKQGRRSVSEPRLIDTDTGKSAAVAIETPAAINTTVQAAQSKRRRLNISMSESVAAEPEKSVACKSTVQTKRQYRRLNVSEPEFIAVDTKKHVSVDLKKPITVDTDKTVAAESACHITSNNNSISPEVLFGDMMEQSTVAKTPTKTHCKRNVRSVSLGSPLKQKNKINSEITTIQKSDWNTSDQNMRKYSLNDNTPSKLNKLLPSNCSSEKKSSQMDSEVIGCREDCDCNTHDVNETIDIVVGNVLHSMFNFFGIRKH